MLRKVVGALFLLVVCVGFTLADEIRAIITKVDGDKITFSEMKGKEKGPEKTMSTTAGVKVVKGKYNKDSKKVEDTQPVEGGLKHQMFSTIGEKGQNAIIITDGGKISEIQAFGGKGKKQ